MSNISMPRVTAAPRELSAVERAVLTRVADTLIPANGEAPAASGDPDFWEGLAIALHARSDAFDDIVGALEALADTAPENLWGELRSMDQEHPATFQALSAVVAGAWLLSATTRDRIGYRGPQSDKAVLDEAADEISSGVLDPVLEREGSRWIR